MSYMVGYSGGSKTLAQLRAWPQWMKLDPEFQRRALWLMDASRLDGKPVGIGGIWRSTATQELGAYSRHFEVAAGAPHCCTYKGKFYQKKSNVAHMIFPPDSYHLDTTPDDKALAIDFIGNMAWLKANVAKVDAITFADVNGEPWHVQCNGYPRGKSRYNPVTDHPLRPIILPPLPGKSTTPLPVPSVEAPLPTMRVGAVNNIAEVRELQVMLNYLKITDAFGIVLLVDGNYGNKTASAVKKLQATLGFTGAWIDGVYGKQTAARFQIYLNSIASLRAA